MASAASPAPGRGWAARLAATLSAAALAGCSAADVLNTLEPKGGVAITRNVAFMPGPRGTLDIYQPRKADGRAPVVVFLYGGGWDTGSKGQYVFAGAALAAKGFVAIVPDYRVFPEVRWPAFLQDNARAVAWARAHAADYGGDPDDLFLMGHSAGAYNAVTLAVDRRWLAEVDVDPRRDIRGVVGLAGPYDFLPLRSDELRTIFGPEAQRPDTQPINHVDGMAPPLFLATDTADKVVDPGNTARMADRIRAAGGQVQTRAYQGLSHSLLMGAVARPLCFLAPVLEDSVVFLRAHQKPAAAPP